MGKHETSVFKPIPCPKCGCKDSHNAYDFGAGYERPRVRRYCLRCGRSTRWWDYVFQAETEWNEVKK